MGRAGNSAAARCGFRRGPRGSSPAPRRGRMRPLLPMSSTPQTAGRRHRRTLVAPLVAALNGWSPFWGPQLIVAVAIVLQFVLPEKLTVGPSWLLPGVEA